MKYHILDYSEFYDQVTLPNLKHRIKSHQIFFPMIPHSIIMWHIIIPVWELLSMKWMLLLCKHLQSSVYVAAAFPALWTQGVPEIVQVDFLSWDLYNWLADLYTDFYKTVSLQSLTGKFHEGPAQNSWLSVLWWTGYFGM